MSNLQDIITNGISKGFTEEEIKGIIKTFQKLADNPNFISSLSDKISNNVTIEDIYSEFNTYGFDFPIIISGILFLISGLLSKNIPENIVKNKYTIKTINGIDWIKSQHNNDAEIDYLYNNNYIELIS